MLATARLVQRWDRRPHHNSAVVPVTAPRLKRAAKLLYLCSVGYPGNALRLRRCHLPDPYDRIYFFHIPKTAGTSIFNAFLALGGEDPRCVLRRMTENSGYVRSGKYLFINSHRPILTRYTPYFFGWSHLPEWRIALHPATFRFTVLRDPVARVVSLYRYLADPRSDAEEVNPAPLHERDWARDGFDEFLQRIPEHHLLAQLYMFSETLDPAMAAGAIRACSTWFFLERFEQGMHEMCVSLGISLPTRQDRRSVAPAPELGSLGKLREMLEREYDLLGELRNRPGEGFVGSFPG
jgi:hypothetical protein